MRIFTLLFFLISAVLRYTSCGDDDFFFPREDLNTSARFTTAGDRLYTIDETRLMALDISSPEALVLIGEIPAPPGVENILHLNGHLLLGTTETTHIYRLQSDGLPTLLTDYDGLLACDPVVLSDTFAYVGKQLFECGPGDEDDTASALDIISVADWGNPYEINSLPMERPSGLAIDGELLFICEEGSGLLILSLEDPRTPQEIVRFGGIYAVEAIPIGNDILLIIGPSQLLQLDYSDLDELEIISTITIES